MKSAEEQIAEMAKIGRQSCDALDYDSYCSTHTCNESCKIFRQQSCLEHDIAQKLYAAGYRKATDVIDEFVERLKEENEISFRRFGKGIGISSVFKIADEMKFELFENGQVNK